MACSGKSAELGLSRGLIKNMAVYIIIFHSFPLSLSPSFFASLLDLAVKIITISISAKNQTKRQNVDTLCRGKCAAAQCSGHCACGTWPMSMSADCTDNCKDIAPPPQLPSPSSPCTVHSEVIDGSWACQLLDRLLYPLHSAVFILFARWQFKQIRATFLLFCWHFAAAHTEHGRATVRQRDCPTKRATKNALQRIAPAFIAACCARCSI